MTRDSRDARVTLDVLVDRDAVVKAALSAKARGNFGGSDNEINRKADAAASPRRSSRSGDV